MSLFEFLMVLVSIIVGLGVAEILTGIARQIRHSDIVQGYWLHSCGVALVFFALLQNWWELWELNSTVVWNFPALVLMLISPASLYLIAHLIFPQTMEGALKDYYHNRLSTIWWLAVLATVSSAIFRPLAFGSALMTMDNASSAVLTVGFIALALSRNRALHFVLIPLFLSLLLVDVPVLAPYRGPGWLIRRSAKTPG